MTSIIKKAAIVIIATTMSVAAFAQEKGDMAAGGNLAIGMGDEITNIGIGGKFQYNVTDPIRLEGSLTFFLPRKYGVSGFAETKVSFWDFSVNGHYLFPVADQITVYPLAGLGIQGWKTKTDAGEWSGYIPGGGNNSGSDVCINIGGGVDFKLTDQLSLNGEMKYRISGDYNRFIISIGAAYKF
jgi:outer membrane protein X